MANLTELSQWETGIYQLETTDSVEAGAGGISNKQARLLGNRTKWLKDNSLVFLKKGTVSVGDIAADKLITISFTSIGTNNYMVTGSLVSLSANYNDDNDVIWTVRNKTSTSFQLCLREVSGNNQNLNFDYVIIPF